MRPQFLLLILSLLILTACEEERESPSLQVFEQGILLLENRDAAQAEQFFDGLIKAPDVRKDTFQLADAYGYLGEALLAGGHYRRSLDAFQTALRLSAERNNFRAEARVRVKLGDFYRLMNDYSAAFDSYDAAFGLYDAFGLNEGKAQVQSRTASLYERLDNSTDAARYYESALAYARAAGDSLSAADALKGLGALRASQGKYSEALDFLTRAREALTRVQSPLEDILLEIEFGNAARTVRNANLALQHYRTAVNTIRSRSAARNLEPLALFSIARVYEDFNRANDALTFTQEARTRSAALGDRVTETYMMLYEARLRRHAASNQSGVNGSRAAAMQYANIAKRFAGIEHSEGEAFALAAAAESALEARDVSRAVGWLQAALDAYEQTSDDYLSEEVHLPIVRAWRAEHEPTAWYDMLAELHLRAGNTVAALETLERKRSEQAHRLFRDVPMALRHPAAGSSAEAVRELGRRIRMLHIELRALLADGSRPAGEQLRSEADELRATAAVRKGEFDQLLERVLRTHQNYESLFRVRRARAQELQRLIPRGTLAVDIFSTSSSTYLLTLSRTTLAVKSVPVPRERLNELKSRFLQLLLDPSVYAGAAGEKSLDLILKFDTLGAQLYNVLVRPLEPLFLENLVFIITDGEEFPYHALTRQMPGRNPQFLIERSSVDYLSSIGAFGYSTTGALRPRTFTAFGNPNGKQWSVDYELRDMRNIIKTVSLNIGVDASLGKFLSARGDVLQLSTDFIEERGRDPFGSFLLSGGTSPEETVPVPFRRFSELPSFPIVVLSSQNPVTGNVRAGHAQFLRVLGTADVFMNVWGPDRRASKIFSETFYGGIASGLAPGDSYRQALLRMMTLREVRHPYYWAQFFHFGTG